MVARPDAVAPARRAGKDAATKSQFRNNVNMSAMNKDAEVRSHYSSNDIADRLLQALSAAGVDVNAPTPLDLAPVDQFHSRGLEATRELAEMLAPTAGERILDIGSGLGGPARFFAFTYDCQVDGIDLTPEFCDAARALVRITGLDGQVHIECASALEPPFDDATFDAAYSQNVVMNIADKPAFYREAWRVLRPGGRLGLSNLAQGPGGPPDYPVPWATTAETSFLATPDETRSEIEAAGFEIAIFQDKTQILKEFLSAQRELIKQSGPPKLGPHVFMGERFKEMQRNVARSVEQGRVLPLEILCRKP